MNIIELQRSRLPHTCELCRSLFNSTNNLDVASIAGNLLDLAIQTHSIPLYNDEEYHYILFSSFRSTPYEDFNF